MKPIQRRIKEKWFHNIPVMHWRRGTPIIQVINNNGERLVIRTNLILTAQGSAPGCGQADLHGQDNPVNIGGYGDYYILDLSIGEGVAIAFWELYNFDVMRGALVEMIKRLNGIKLTDDDRNWLACRLNELDQHERRI